MVTARCPLRSPQEAMPVGNRSSQSPRGPRSLREDLLGQSWMTGLVLPGLQTHFPISGLPAWLSRCAPVPWAEPIRAEHWSEWYPGRGCVWGDSAEPPVILSIPAAGGKIILPRKIQVCVFCFCLEAAGWIFAERLLKIISVCPAGPSLAQSLLHIILYV